MMTFLKLVLIGAASGLILSMIMKVIYKLTGNKAEILLYNMEYMPVFKRWSDRWITGIIFHYMTCIASAVLLFYLLIPVGLASAIWPYILVYTSGSAALYLLSALTDAEPEHTDAVSWFNWTFSHGIFGLSVGLFIMVWVS